MAKHQYIPCDIYKRGIGIFVGTLNEFQEWVAKKFTDGTDRPFVSMVMNTDESGALTFLGEVLFTVALAFGFVKWVKFVDKHIKD